MLTMMPPNNRLKAKRKIARFNRTDIQAEGATLAQHETLRNLLEHVLFLPMRMRRRLSSRAKYKIRLQTFATTRRTLEGLSNLKADGHRTVFNVGLYLLLLDQDLADFTDSLIYAIGERRRVFIAKHEAILLYEAAEDLPQMLGRQFRDALELLGASKEQQQRLNVVSSELNQFWQAEKEFLSKIRNSLAAHREHDALGYIKALEQVEPLAVMERGVDLSSRIDKLLKVLNEIVLTASAPGSILCDILISSKKQASQQK